jgi:hypothetical protein
MTSLLKKFKLLSIGAMSLMFIVAVTMSSCTPKESTEGTEVDEVEVVEEVPAEEHPADGEEHPSDSTKAEGEHPADSEHPDN